MKFALISTHGVHKARFKLDCQAGDCTSFISWVNIWDGFHFNFEELQKEDMTYLKQFDVVMMSGHLRHIVDIINIAKMLKDSNAVSMFYPEGSTQLYENSIRGFHKEYYEAWNACDILSICEEDKVSYYKSFVSPETVVKFIHVPITHDMEAGSHMRPRKFKQNYSLVYGDNNPNHPLIAIAAAKRSSLEVFAVEFGSEEVVENVRKTTGHPALSFTDKMSQSAFLDFLGRSMVHFYPTEWIGTSRQSISCAAVGTPCIGNMHSHTQQRLFPELGCWIYDIDKMVDLANKLITDQDYYSLIANRAFERLQFYNISNTKKRFMEAWEEAKEIKMARKAAVAVA